MKVELSVHMRTDNRFGVTRTIGGRRSTDMSMASKIALEKAAGLAIGLMGLELIVRSIFNLSLAIAIFSRVLR